MFYFMHDMHDSCMYIHAQGVTSQNTSQVRYAQYERGRMKLFYSRRQCTEHSVGTNARTGIGKRTGKCKRQAQP